MRDYKAELREATEQLRASMAACPSVAWEVPQIQHKGRTLLVVRGERTELKARVRDTRPIGQRTPETNAATVCGFRFEYRAKGGSGFYWNGKRVASTREGLERMGPAVLAKVCR